MTDRDSRLRAEFEVTKQTVVSVDGTDTAIRVVRRESRNKAPSFRLVSPFWKIAWFLRYVLVRPARWLAKSDSQWVVLSCPNECQNCDCVQLGHARQLHSAFDIAIVEASRLTRATGAT
jgi:hypothetical protein